MPGMAHFERTGSASLEHLTVLKLLLLCWIIWAAVATRNGGIRPQVVRKWFDVTVAATLVVLVVVVHEAEASDVVVRNLVRLAAELLGFLVGRQFKSRLKWK